MKRLVSLMLAFCLIAGMSGCKTEETDTKQQAMGRYIETTIAEDLEGASSIMDFHYAENELVFYTGQYYDDPTKLLRQTVGEDQKLTGESMQWAKSLAEQNLKIIDLDEGVDGTVYILAQNDEEAQVFYTTLEDTQLNPIPVSDWPESDESNYSIMVGDDSVHVEEGKTFVGELESATENGKKSAVPSGILATPEGFLLIYNDQIESRDMSGVKEKTFNGFFYLSDRDVCVQNNQIVVKNSQVSEIQIYDLSTGELLRKHSCEENVQSLVGMDQQENVYLISNTGIYQQSSGGTLWEKMVEGDLTSLGMPSKYVDAVSEDGTGGFYAVLGSESGYSLMHYFYSPDTPVQPDTELTIFSLKDSNILRQAISEFQHQNPNVKVNLQIGMANEEESATTQDVILSLNTEILNGNGPDLIVLDGLPAESYLEKGVLADLSGYLQKMEGGTILENMLTGYQRDGKLFAIPAQFTIPIYLSQNNEDEVDSLSALLQKTKEGADQKPPYLLSLDVLEMEDKVSFVMNWYDRLEMGLIKDQTIDTQKLEQFFQNVKELFDTQSSYTPLGEGAVMAVSASVAGSSGVYEVLDMGPSRLSNGEASAYAMTMTGQSNLANLLKLAEQGNWSLTSLFQQNQFIPQVNVGILESSEQKELAESFLTTLYSQSVQSVYLGSGFPINQSALKELITKSLSDEDGNLYPMGEEFYQLCQQANQAILTDETVRNAVKTQAEFVMDGSLSAKQAAENVSETVKLYLAE